MSDKSIEILQNFLSVFVKRAGGKVEIDTKDLNDLDPNSFLHFVISETEGETVYTIELRKIQNVNIVGGEPPKHD